MLGDGRGGEGRGKASWCSGEAHSPRNFALLLHPDGDKLAARRLVRSNLVRLCVVARPPSVVDTRVFDPHINLITERGKVQISFVNM